MFCVFYVVCVLFCLWLSVVFGGLVLCCCLFRCECVRAVSRVCVFRVVVLCAMLGLICIALVFVCVLLLCCVFK